MGMILAVANMERVVLKADGYKKVYDADKYVDDYERIIVFNENCMIGFTGFDEMAKMLIGEYIRMANEANVDISTLAATTVVYDLCEFAKEVNKENAELSMIVAGKQEGNIVLFAFSSMDQYEINNFSPEDDKNIKYITLGADRSLQPMDYGKFYRPVEPIETTMNNYIRYMGSIDSKINDHIKTKKINL